MTLLLRSPSLYPWVKDNHFDDLLKDPSFCCSTSFQSRCHWKISTAHGHLGEPVGLPDGQLGALDEHFDLEWPPEKPPKWKESELVAGFVGLPDIETDNVQELRSK